jgi:hypothetical protein
MYTSYFNDVDLSRNLLCDVVGIKVELYLMSKSRSTTAEEALKVLKCESTLIAFKKHPSLRYVS